MYKKGLLIALEGIDGAGKSLLAQNLYKDLSKKNIDVLLTKQPGGTHLGKKLRKILHEKKEHVSDLAEFLLFAADRAQHFEQIIIPALKEGKIIISDRLSDSSLAYQGYGRNLDKEKIKVVNNWIMQNKEPDIIFYIEIDTKTAHQRIFERNQNLTSFEKEKAEFWEKTIYGYNQIFKDKNNVFYLDGKKTPEQIKQEALNIIFDKLNKNK
ncbi:dTMP kinase [Candidatus Dependentiae bacterium]|nr:dTMP kinase [Candidatus Dependentiae bacterium]